MTAPDGATAFAYTWCTLRLLQRELLAERLGQARAYLNSRDEHADPVGAYDYAVEVLGDRYRFRPLGATEAEYDAHICSLREARRAAR